MIKLQRTLVSGLARQLNGFKCTSGVLSRSCSRAVAVNDDDKSGETSLAERPPARLITIKDALIAKPSPETVAFKGWINSIRKFPEFIFLTVTDKIRDYQVIVPRALYELKKEELNVGSTATFSGVIRESQGTQPLELECEYILVYGSSPVSMIPFSEKNKTTIEWSKLRQHLHLRPRVNRVAALLRIRSKLVTEIYNFMQREEFYNVTTPIITTNDCEGAGDTFTVTAREPNPFFGKEAHLSVSGQLHLEAMAAAMGKVFTLSPAFRAENSQTRRHLAEFTMLEAEEYFLDSLDVLMDRVEHLTKSLTQFVFDNCTKDQEYLSSVNKHPECRRLLNDKYIRITYNEAIELINKQQKIDHLEYGNDISRHHEKVLLDYFEGIPIFITHYPASLKPFYMKQEDGKALCFDLIVRAGGELCGGSLREDNYEILRERIEKMDRLKSLEWYLDLRKIGNAPHGGYGMGLERLIQTVTGIENVKDAIPFPRWVKHCPL